MVGVERERVAGGALERVDPASRGQPGLDKLGERLGTHAPQLGHGVAGGGVRWVRPVDVEQEVGALEREAVDAEQLAVRVEVAKPAEEEEPAKRSCQ